MYSFGLSNLHYAVTTEEGYAKPVRIPGAVRVNLDPEYIDLSFTGLDGVPQPNPVLYGYTGTMTIAEIPKEAYAQLYRNYILKDSNSLIECVTPSITSPSVALLYESSGKPSVRSVFYKCSFGYSSIVAETKTDTTTILTVSIPISIRFNDSGYISYKVFDENTTKYKNWFEAVQIC